MLLISKVAAIIAGLVILSAALYAVAGDSISDMFTTDNTISSTSPAYEPEAQETTVSGVDNNDVPTDTQTGGSEAVVDDNSSVLGSDYIHYVVPDSAFEDLVGHPIEGELMIMHHGREVGFVEKSYGLSSANIENQGDCIYQNSIYYGTRDIIGDLGTFEGKDLGEMFEGKYGIPDAIRIEEYLEYDPTNPDHVEMYKAMGDLELNSGGNLNVDRNVVAVSLIKNGEVYETEYFVNTFRESSSYVACMADPEFYQQVLKDRSDAFKAFAPYLESVKSNVMS